MLFDTNILPFDGEVLYYPQFLKDSKAVFNDLVSSVNWKQEGMKMYGKQIPFPRLTAWYSENQKTYTYSGLKNIPLDFSESLFLLKSNIEQFTGHAFNAALLNYYRHGQDSMGWHADNEPELGMNPVIASLNFGASRKFQFKHRNIPKSTISINLEPGSLLLMKGETQHHWLHQVPKVKESQPRINITFRFIY